MPSATVAADFDHPATKLSLGMPGTAHSDLRPSGKALIEGQYIDVVSDGEYVERGSTVHIVRIEGNIVTVRKS
ncbi:MAG: NfeD family protein [Pirellulales bacterium]